MDPSNERKAFDEKKTGVKGLADSGITEIPAMFRAPPTFLGSLKAARASHEVKIPTVDLKGGSAHYKNQDPTTRRNVVEQIGEAAEKWGFFRVTVPSPNSQTSSVQKRSPLLSYSISGSETFGVSVSS